MASYIPEDIYQLGINEMKNKDQLKAIDTEAIVVGKHIAIIEQYAIKIGTTLSKLKVPLGLENFKSLTSDLQQVLLMIHQLVKLHLDNQDDRNQRLTKSRAFVPKLPAIFQKPAAAETVGTLCPLTVFLQAVSNSLTKLKVGHVQGGMGSAQAIIGLLQAMREKLSDVSSGDECRGLANCIIIHEKNSRFLVFGTAPVYRKLLGLQKFAWATRESYLKNLQRGLPNEVKLKLLEAERFSRQILEATRTGEKPTRSPDWYTQLVIEGNNATVTAKGQYKPACLTDWLRMAIARPQDAQKEENEILVTDRRPQTQTTSCAEWVLINYLFYSPDPANPPQQGTPTAGNHKKSDSWPKNDEKPKPSVAVATAPPPLPNTLGQPRTGQGRAPSPPGNSSTTKLADRTKKI